MFNLPMNPMNMSMMQGPAAPAPVAPQPNNMQAFFNNPMTSIGMGLLGGNYGPNSRAAFANAMKGGMVGMQQAQASQQRQLQAEAMKQEMLMAQAKARKQQEMEEKVQEYIDKVSETDPAKAEMLRILNPTKVPDALMDMDKMAEQQRQFGITTGLNQQRIAAQKQGLGIKQQQLELARQGVTNTQNAVLPDGTQTLAMENNRGGTPRVLTESGWVDAPAGTRFFGTQVTGDTESTGIGATTATKTANQRAMAASQDLITLVDRFSEVAKPENFGIVGSLRGTFQDARSQMGALGDWASNASAQARSAKVKPGEKWSYDEWFDPSLPAQEYLENTIAYAQARANDPGGRISDMDFKASKEGLKLNGGLSNINSVTARMNEARLNAFRTHNNAAARIGANPYVPQTSADEDAEFEALLMGGQ